MNYKIPLCLLVLVLANVSYLVIVHFVPDWHVPYKDELAEALLGLDGTVFMVFFIGYLWQWRAEALAANDEEAQEAAYYEMPVLSPQNQDYLRVIEHIPDFLCLKDRDGHWLRASRSYLLSLNLQDVDYIGKTDDELIAFPQSNARALRLSGIQDKSAWHLRRKVKETRVIPRLDNKSEILEIIRTPVFDVMQNRLYLLVTGHFVDQTEKTKLGQVEQAFQVCHWCFVFLDAQFRINRVNPAFTQLTGYVFDEINHQPMSRIIDDQIELIRTDFFNNEQEVLWSGELNCRHKNGKLLPVRLDIIAIAQEGKEVSYFATLFDITAQKQSEQRVMQIAHYDDLTGLVNRVVFFNRLNLFLKEVKHKTYFAVIFFIDLDRFKTVNDSLGHDAGNSLLKDTAVRLRAIMREDDVVARLSGDEFALLLLNQTSHEQALYSASMIAGEIIHKLSEVYHIQSREVFIGASVGISMYPDDGTTAEVLLKHADIAMYEAKKQGRNNYQFYKKDYAAATQDRLLMELDLRKALEKNELQLYYQPQYYAASRTIFGAEVLIRWFQGSTKPPKMIPPDKFISIAEETGLIVEIGEWIMKVACLQMKKWLLADYPLKQVSVNVSARQFTDNNFLKSVEDALSQAKLDSKHLELEITESMLVGDIKQIELQLQRLKKMGIKIALDDFGTGYSSLSYLKSFPIDVLKIDQSFIREMTVESKDARLTSAIIEMGHSLGQKIIAEGVETEQQLEYLTHRGCDIIQGYFFSKPLPTQDMTNLLAKEAQRHLTSSQRKALPSSSQDTGFFDKGLL
ncbi:putative bifunctional diguanylate cyclase/phosphodiesterase [Methylovulum psychrotolerans]|uniref:cyclic-guanylate-specific phosphodiesterase n=1 Tax=Methylovulum psychrotolerans TaxID=1704499 RepID=A0A1Z4BX15_9GAMM|nr:bifunctional diguanylate cyclase/phosphodiesterase [Methylovulum psychrotolerans]ASF45844.1 PAS domain S-box protein [Methylovulum psychrotolerans]MBT9097216.1 EAL domain-containing protein [Methylovulum psychrotolerans]